MNAPEMPWKKSKQYPCILLNLYPIFTKTFKQRHKTGSRRQNLCSGNRCKGDEGHLICIFYSKVLHMIILHIHTLEFIFVHRVLYL